MQPDMKFPAVSLLGVRVCGIFYDFDFAVALTISGMSLDLTKTKSKTVLQTFLEMASQIHSSTKWTPFRLSQASSCVEHFKTNLEHFSHLVPKLGNQFQ
jgi:ABC-type uncharacterized transport system involved in gliding motility auxiliary subunit